MLQLTFEEVLFVVVLGFMDQALSSAREAAFIASIAIERNFTADEGYYGCVFELIADWAELASSESEKRDD